MRLRVLKIYNQQKKTRLLSQTKKFLRVDLKETIDEPEESVQFSKEGERDHNITTGAMSIPVSLLKTPVADCKTSFAEESLEMPICALDRPTVFGLLF